MHFHLGKHYEEKHHDNTVIEKSADTDSTDDGKMKEEIRLLKNNFQRLESMYQESVKENNKVKSEYEAKLIEANDRYRVVKADNEELKEKVDILFKLGRSYINRKENTTDELDTETNVQKNKDTPNANNEDLIETVIIEETGTDDLHTWTQNKMRGFKRTGPTTASEKVSRQTNTPKMAPKPPGPPTSPPTPSTTLPTSHSSGDSSNSNSDQYQGRYCHYFVNQGTCRH